MPFANKKISAYEAMYEAQKIAYAPVIFQVVRTLRELGILGLLEQSGKTGMGAAAISESLDIRQYGVETLLESGHSCGVVDYKTGDNTTYKNRIYFLTKIGYYILNDVMTTTNMDFNHHVCYQGFADLDKSIKDGRPRGLGTFGGQWETLYQALPHLPEQAKKSWYAFDNYYSDTTYPLILPMVLENQPSSIVDIGTNMGKFAILLARSDPELEITMLDLPDQLAVAAQNVEEAGFSHRITAHAMNVLDTDLSFPAGLDVYWMSQFASCFWADELVSIFSRIAEAMTDQSRFFVMETCWDRQKHEAAAFSLVNTSPYFTCMANGNSKMYHSEELLECVASAGLELIRVTDDLSICHSLFEFRLPRSGF